MYYNAQPICFAIHSTALHLGEKLECNFESNWKQKKLFQLQFCNAQCSICNWMQHNYAIIWQRKRLGSVELEQLIEKFLLKSTPE